MEPGLMLTLATMDNFMVAALLMDTMDSTQLTTTIMDLAILLQNQTLVPVSVQVIPQIATQKSIKILSSTGPMASLIFSHQEQGPQIFLTLQITIKKQILLFHRFQALQQTPLSHHFQVTQILLFHRFRTTSLILLFHLFQTPQLPIHCLHFQTSQIIIFLIHR